jgi:hypothetical protein
MIQTKKARECRAYYFIVLACAKGLLFEFVAFLSLQTSFRLEDDFPENEFGKSLNHLNSRQEENISCL